MKGRRSLLININYLHPGGHIKHLLSSDGGSESAVTDSRQWPWCWKCRHESKEHQCLVSSNDWSTTFKCCSCTLKYDYLIFFCFRRQASLVCIQNSVRLRDYHVKLHRQTWFIICPIFSILREAFFTPSRVVRGIDPVQSWVSLTTFRPWLSKLENSLTDCWNTKSDLRNQTKLWTCISCQCFLEDKEIQTHLCETWGPEADTVWVHEVIKVSRPRGKEISPLCSRRAMTSPTLVVKNRVLIPRTHVKVRWLW